MAQSKPLEEQAREYGNDRVGLRKALKSATLLLDGKLQPLFRKGRFDFNAKRLYTEDGRACLEWRLRQNPAGPVGYENQQTSVGVIVFRILDGGQS